MGPRLTANFGLHRFILNQIFHREKTSHLCHDSVNNSLGTCNQDDLLKNVLISCSGHLVTVRVDRKTRPKALAQPFSVQSRAQMPGPVLPDLGTHPLGHWTCLSCNRSVCFSLKWR